MYMSCMTNITVRAMSRYTHVYICHANRIHHMDLYRLAGDNDKDLDPLDMQNVLTNCTFV